jgi:hypothetical protein
MSNKVTFPVTVTGMNITERNVEGKFGLQDKAGITIQETNVIDEGGNNIVIPAGAWLNGFTPAGALDAVAVGHTIAVQIRTKANPNGGFYYNFSFYPPKVATPAAPAAAVAPAPVAGEVMAPMAINPAHMAPEAEPVGQPVTREEFDALANTVLEIQNDMTF